jgi:hypothetical protein
MEKAKDKKTEQIPEHEPIYAYPGEGAREEPEKKGEQPEIEIEMWPGGRRPGTGRSTQEMEEWTQAIEEALEELSRGQVIEVPVPGEAERELEPVASAARMDGLNRSEVAFVVAAAALVAAMVVAGTAGTGAAPAAAGVAALIAAIAVLPADDRPGGAFFNAKSAVSSAFSGPMAWTSHWAAWDAINFSGTEG